MLPKDHETLPPPAPHVETADRETAIEAMRAAFQGEDSGPPTEKPRAASRRPAPAYNFEQERRESDQRSARAYAAAMEDSMTFPVSDEEE